MKRVKQLPRALKELQEQLPDFNFYEFGPRERIPENHVIMGMVGRYTYTGKKKRAKKNAKNNGGENEQGQTS